jgi:phospholipase C
LRLVAIIVPPIWVRVANDAKVGGYYSVNYETYICDRVEHPQIWANEVIIGQHIQPAGYYSNPAKLKNQP